MRVCESVVMNIGTTSRRALVARRDFLFRKSRLRLTGCRSSPQKPRVPRIAGRSFFWRNPPFHFRFIARRRALSSGEMQRDSSIFWIALLYVQSSNAVVSRKANVLSRYFAIAVAAAHAAPIL